ncbi:superkiller viralicidic activity 2 2 [Echinococcus multilocularis]|uniref:Superkiller viralicidic activity 2 2 n=1 Tax=Echinococcus multilocularis TaxID=6211 RepID=A0A068Y750_ECHMU|nr:superkiller viralicidic activity 2 2 [Echinococcus multilocularis]
MSNVFGVDIDELASVFEDKGTGEIPIAPVKSKDAGQVDEEFEKKKRKVEENLREHINISTKVEHVEPSKDPKLSSVLESTLSKAPRIKIYKIPAPSTCTHEVAYPPGIPFKKLEVISEPKILTFPFTLDPFQNQALLCIDNNESVMVSAHTSAGKTVIAEYAIAKALRDKQRVIYTTPIKALSNQKYREFSEEFPEVGLLTGDATININASVLIMTTEILQSMLYRGSSIMREVGWVVFDEIHYMRDPERGVVWEESLVLLPDCVRFVFLSATTPNARQFAEWIAFLHAQPCHVVTTDTRPVPLRHYIYPLGGDGLYLVLNEGNYIEENFRKAMASFPKQKELGGPGASRAKTGPVSKKTEDNVSKMVRLVKKHNLEPVIVFCFSRKECEIYALKMSECDFITPADKNVVEEVFKNAIGGLSPEDRCLPQVESVLPLLKKGIGIHHGGLLPILKETVEILFGEGLMKCLFATETFAMGLNMPARTVVFTSVRKYDGVNYRWITAGEYIQMSGRAGRRGKDASGTVILMVDETLTEQAGHAILQGKPAPLNSAFHITYNMLLNLLRVEEINPEYLMERSFCQFQNYSRLPELSEELNRLQTELSTTVLEEEKAVESYRKIQLCLQEIVEQQWRYIRRPEHIVSFLQPGRLVKIESEGDDYGWGVVVNLKKRHRNDRVSALETFYILDCLLATRPTADTAGAGEAPSTSAPKSAEILPVRLDCVCGISAVRLMVPQDLRSPEARSLLYASIEKVKTKLGVADLPHLDPVRDMHITDAKFKEITEKVRLFEQRLEAHPLHKSPRLPELLGAYERREAQRRRIDEVTRSLTQKVSLIQMDDLVGRKRVLRRLGFCNEHDVIELKGRVACEITSADELVLTELLFEGIFNRLSAEQVASLLSCFVFDERASEMPKLSAEMAGALRTLQDIARRVARISRECHLPVDPDSYVDSFKPYLMDLVLSWAHGATFASVCAGTDLFEGTIIRCLRLLEELLRQMTNAARTIGNAVLEAKFSEAIEKIKRDIVFAASLYL